MSPLAILRADAGPEEGGGHVSRCLVLADELIRRGWRCILATQKSASEFAPAIRDSRAEVAEFEAAEIADFDALKTRLGLSADLAVIDGYRFSYADERAARGWARHILALDDQPNRNHECDLLVDQTPGRRVEAYRDRVPFGATVLTGSDYVLLHPPFRTESATGARSGLVISFGASDETDLTGRTLRELADSGWSEAVEIILPRAAPHFASIAGLVPCLPFRARLVADAGPAEIARLYASAALAAGAAGVSTWERCATGLPSVLVTVADNQVNIAEAVSAAGAALWLGKREHVVPGAIAAAIEVLAVDAQRRTDMSEAAKRVCDGCGARRVADAVEARTMH